jgi:hypothetical protein
LIGCGIARRQPDALERQRDGSQVWVLMLGNVVFEPCREMPLPRGDLYQSASGAGAASGSVGGLFYTWTYFDLTVAFGSFDVTNGANKTLGETFRIGYRVNF